MNKSKRRKALAILIFFLGATLISLIFRVINVKWLEPFNLPHGNFNGMSLFVGLGPILMATLCRKWFSDNRTFLPIWGNSKIKSALFLAIPIITIVHIGVINNKCENLHTYALYVCMMWLLYIFGEEFGWRGYLQHLLIRSNNDFLKAILIGIIWYLWHLSFFYVQYSFAKELFFVCILIIGSFVILKVVSRTNSLLVAVALHFSFSVLTNITLPTNSYVPLTLMCICWVILYCFWNRGFLASLK